jgi:peptide chain release factor subunit 3
VISARKGEFETGFDRGGQTREHAMLAKTLGIAKLVVLVNKMDEKTVEWSEARFNEIEGKLTPFLKKWGFKSSDIFYIPMSGWTGHNLGSAPVGPEICSWYKGPAFLQLLDQMPPLERDSEGPARMPIIGRYKDMGVLCCIGKLEVGTFSVGQDLIMMPNNVQVQVTGIDVEEKSVDRVGPGENLVIKIKGIEEDDVHEGFVLCEKERPIMQTKDIECQVVVLPLLEHKPLLTAGYQCVLHAHALSVECSIEKLLSEMDKASGKFGTKVPRFLRDGSVARVRITMDETVAVESFKDVPSMGRFTLRDEGKTIAVGKVIKCSPVEAAAAAAAGKQ